MQLLAKDFMTKSVKTALDTDSILKVGQIMADNAISSVVILNKKKEIVGVMTERDMVRDVLYAKVPYTRPIKEVLTSPVNKVEVEADINILSRFLMSKKIKRLIVTKKGKMVGILTLTDMLKASLEFITQLNKRLVLGKFDNQGFKKRIGRIYRVVNNLKSKKA